MQVNNVDHMQKNSSLLSKAAHQRYELDREQQKKKAKQEERNQRLKILKSEIKDIMQKKQLLLEACENIDQDFVNIIKVAENNIDI